MSDAVRRVARGQKLQVMTTLQFIARLKLSTPPDTWGVVHPQPKAFIAHYTTNPGLCDGQHLLRSWCTHTEDDQVFGSYGFDRCATGAHLDALLALSDVPRTGDDADGMQFTPSRVGQTWSGNYAVWDHHSITRTLCECDEYTNRSLFDAHNTHVFGACNREGGILGEVLQHLRCCERLVPLGADLEVVAHVLAHVLRQHRAAIASIAAQRVLSTSGGVEEALRICTLHDEREKALSVRLDRFTHPHHRHLLPYQHLLRAGWFEYGLPLLGGTLATDSPAPEHALWRHSGETSPAHILHRLVRVKGKGTYDMPRRDVASCTLRALVCADVDKTRSALKKVITQHVDFKGYSQFFPSFAIGELAHFITTRLPNHCASILPHIAEANARAVAGGDQTNTQVATWAAFGCPRSIHSFTCGGAVGKRLASEFPPKERGMCLPTTIADLSRMVPTPPNTARGVEVEDVLSTVIDHLAAVTRPAHSTIDPASWANLLAATDPVVHELARTTTTVQVQLDRPVLVDDEGRGVRGNAAHRSWNALLHCISADTEKRFMDIKHAEGTVPTVSFKILNNEWDTATAIRAARKNEMADALKDAALVARLWNRQDVSNWRRAR